MKGNTNMRHGIQNVKILNGLRSASGFLFWLCTFSPHFMAILNVYTLEIETGCVFFYMKPVDMTMSVRKYCAVNG